MTEERKAALKELEHSDILQQILACLWLLDDRVALAKRTDQIDLSHWGVCHEPVAH
jgi:hypothetical protein